MYKLLFLLGLSLVVTGCIKQQISDSQPLVNENVEKEFQKTDDQSTTKLDVSVKDFDYDVIDPQPKTEPVPGLKDVVKSAGIGSLDFECYNCSN